jgi:tetratricopeptide (TPR) repeat protein
VQISPALQYLFLKFQAMLQQAEPHDDARAAFQQALARNPRMDRAWYGLSLVLIEQGQFHDAVTALKKNTGLRPSAGAADLAGVGNAAH